jgi:hypothetical protein
LVVIEWFLFNMALVAWSCVTNQSLCLCEQEAGSILWVVLECFAGTCLRGAGLSTEDLAGICGGYVGLSGDLVIRDVNRVNSLTLSGELSEGLN